MNDGISSSTPILVGVNECRELEERVAYLITMFSMQHNRRDVRAANFDSSEFVDPAVSLWIRQVCVRSRVHFARVDLILFSLYLCLDTHPQDRRVHRPDATHHSQHSADFIQRG